MIAGGGALNAFHCCITMACADVHFIQYFLNLLIIFLFHALILLLWYFFNFTLGFQQSIVGDPLLSCNQTEEYSLLQSCNDNMPVVGLDSMQMANSTLEDFVSVY